MRELIIDACGTVLLAFCVWLAFGLVWTLFLGQVDAAAMLFAALLFSGLIEYLILRR
jgi:hypothetical protein